MKIAIVGAGRVGTALARRWGDAGHEVVLGVRDPGKAREPASLPRLTVADAVAGADVALLALPWTAVQEVVTATEWGDTILADATNPFEGGRLATPVGTSGAELVAGWARSGRVVKAFNTTGSANMTDPQYAVAPTMPVAGDDDEAKTVVLALAGEIGFDPVDAGPLWAAADLEHLALLWVRLAYGLGNGPDIAFSLLRRSAHGAG